MAKKNDTIINEQSEGLIKDKSYNPLLNALRENDKKNLFKTNVVTAFHKTGFAVFDHYFGAVVNIHDKDGKFIKQEPRVGQAAGTFNLIIANTGAGKTTFASQVAANIMRQYPYSNVIHFDCEERFDVSRCETITKLPARYFEEDRYMIKTGAVGLDVIQEMIVKSYTAKMKIGEELMVDTGYTDEFGKPVRVFQPTIVIIDSMTAVIDKTFNVDNAKEASEAEKMRSNTDGARDSKTLKGFFKDILPLCKEANIIIYGINHINTNMSMNAFTPVAKQQNYLKQDESIPGGKSMLYYPFNIIKMVAKPADDFTEEADGFSGHIVMFEPIKSSSNQSGNNSKGISFEMVFAHKYGFDALRTLIHYGRQNGIIEGNKTRMRFKDDNTFTFTWKNINQEAKEKPIYECIRKYIIPVLEEHLPYIEPDEIEFDDNIFNY